MFDVCLVYMNNADGTFETFTKFLFNIVKFMIIVTIMTMKTVIFIK